MSSSTILPIFRRHTKLYWLTHLFIYYTASLFVYDVVVYDFAVNALSSSSTNTAAANSYMTLQNGLFSPSGKLTLSVELIIPEPKDPTGILLQMNSINTLSLRVRSSQTNVAFVHGTTSAIQTFASEQKQAYGRFPGPVPIVYTLGNGSTEYNLLDVAVLGSIAEAGAHGVLIPIICSSLDGTYNEELWSKTSKAAFSFGLQPIPELIFVEGAEDEDIDTAVTEATLEQLIEKVCINSTNGIAVVACVCTIIPRPDKSNTEIEASDKDDDDDDVDNTFIHPAQYQDTLSPKTTSDLKNEGVGMDSTTNVSRLPKVSKRISKKFSVLGSIRSIAGDNQLSTEVASLKQLGYTGGFLRTECIPGYDRFRDADNSLDIVSRFWEACITDLKSTRSKNFGGFRSKNNMDMTTADKWIRYRKSVLDSGALGDPNESQSLSGGDEGSGSFNSAAGDYKGFA